MLNIYHLEKSNYVNGCGNRYVIWVQGCTLGCRGCWNQKTWNRRPNQLVSVESLFADIQAQEGLDGVTFSGGEPFQQAKELAQLAFLIKTKTLLGLHIFTGFELEELKTDAQKNLMQYTDVLVYGRFDTSKANNNQKVWNKNMEFWNFNNTDVQIDINEQGDLLLTGYPPDDLIQIMQMIQKQGV